MPRRTNVELIIEAVGVLGEATTAEIISWIHDQGCKPPPPRVVSQICSCLSLIRKADMRGAYVVWGKAKDFDEKLRKRREGKTGAYRDPQAM